MIQTRFLAMVMTVLGLLAAATPAYSQINRFSQPRYVPKGPASYDTVGRSRIQNVVNATQGMLEREIDAQAYVLGPGDVLVISIPTSSVEQFECPVTPEGKLLIPQVGIVDVRGKLLADARTLIEERVKKVFRVNTVDILLSQLRQFKVFVLGAVRIPSVVTATAADRVFDVIERVGGIVDTGSVRGISIIRENVAQPTMVDLQRYLSYGDATSNPTVLGGDRIIVPLRNARNSIRVTGEVAQQGSFDYVENDSLSTVIRLAGGFLPSAQLDSVQLVRVNENGSTLENITVDLTSWHSVMYQTSHMPGDVALRAGDRVYVRAIPKWKQREEVVITGEVRYPGRYPIIPQRTTLSDLIGGTGGFTEKASLEDARVIRTSELLLEDKEYERLSKLPPSEMSSNELQYYKTKSREVKGVLSVDFVSLFEQNISQNNPVLRDGDSIVIPSRNLYVNVTGSVRSPGRVVYQEGLSYMDYINLAGGYGFRADQEATLVIKGRGDQFPADSEQDYSIEPGDNILVLDEPEVKFIDVFTKVLTITTQIVTVFAVIYTIVRLQ